MLHDPCRITTEHRTEVDCVAANDSTALDGTAPSSPVTRYLLWMDGVGGFLICLSERLTVGQHCLDATADIALLADVSRQHANLRRDGEGYSLEALRPVSVNGQPRQQAMLRSGDRVTLGATCQLQFWQPVPVSKSARLDLASNHRFAHPVQAVLLMSDSLVFGPGTQSHVVVSDLKQRLILCRNKTELEIRWPGEVLVDGVKHTNQAPLEPGSTVLFDSFALALEPVA